MTADHPVRILLDDIGSSPRQDERCHVIDCPLAADLTARVIAPDDPAHNTITRPIAVVAVCDQHFFDLRNGAVVVALEAQEARPRKLETWLRIIRGFGAEPEQEQRDDELAKDGDA